MTSKSKRAERRERIRDNKERRLNRLVAKKIADDYEGVSLKLKLFEPQHYYRSGRPISLRKYLERSADRKYRQLRYTRGDDWSVSTIWIGKNLNFLPGELLIFETLVQGGPMSEFQDRYATEAEAVEGHNTIVEQVRKLQCRSRRSLG